MRVGDVVPGRYRVRGDIVEVIAVVKGRTERASRVCFVLHKKQRAGGALKVGDTGELGIVTFASGAVPEREPTPDRSTPASVRLNLLSPQQRKCLTLLAEGLTDAEIAVRLDIAQSTVANHLKAVRQRTGLPTRATRVALLRRFYTLSPRTV